MLKMTVAASTPYDILIDRDILGQCCDFIKPLTKAKKILVISDSNVAPLYAKRIVFALEKENFNASLFTFPAGEENKTFGTVSSMLDAMCRFGLTREDMVIAVGGGVTGDMVGFAASIYLRGIDFVQIPTSLLSQVDSSVGGKTGCDLPFGKNLVGAFHNPRLVLIDTATLDTLPSEFFCDGMGEVIKTGAIKDEKLFNCLSAEDSDLSLEKIIYSCVNIKRQVVENDFKEAGQRRLLNFGHTLGHAIELYYNFKGITHGEAVGVGMLMITKAAEQNGLTKAGTAEKIECLLKEFNLKTQVDAPLNELLALCRRDKKSTTEFINLVLLNEIGNAYVHKIPLEELESFFGV